MASRQTQNDGRKQVELNLNPVALRPTVRAGGNYRVAVQQTPKTNSAMQLSQALKQGVSVYGQAVNIAQNKAQEDVATMSEEDFNTFLEQGLDKESRSIFGYTKAYNQSLAKKYYAEEMPTKLQAIASELHKDPYQYKDPQHFEAAATAAVNEAYAEADELLGGNVFSEQANNALKSVTKADFVAKQQEAYLQKLPEITRKIQSDTAFKAFSEITDTDKVKESINQQLTAVASAVGNNRDAAAIVTKGYLDVVELMAKEGKHDEAQQMLDELDSTELASLGMQGKRKFGKGNVELFNTAENRSRIEAIQDAIENDSARSMTLKKNRAVVAVAGIENELFSIITSEGGSEEKGFEYTQKLLDEIAENKSLTIGDKVYDDSIEIQQIRNALLKAQANPALFKLTSMSNFIATNGQSEAYAIAQLRTPDTLKTINKEAYDLLVDEALWKQGRPAFTPEGVEFNSAFTAKQEALEQNLFRSISHLQEGEKQAQFSALYPEKVTAPMQAWVTETLDSLVPDESAVEESSYITPERVKFIKENYPDMAEEIIEEEKKNNRDAQQEYSLFNRDGDTVTFTTMPDTDFRLVPVDPTSAYTSAREKEYFKDDEAQRKAFNTVFRGFREDPYGSGAKDRVIRHFKREPWFGSQSLIERAEKSKFVRDKISLYGISLKELLDGEFGTSFKRIPLDQIYGKGIDFASFPIVIQGDIGGIITEAKAYKEDPENYTNPALDILASNNNITLSQLMDAQYSFLTNGKFITE
jgi:hypothetical protein